MSFLMAMAAMVTGDSGRRQRWTAATGNGSNGGSDGGKGHDGRDGREGSKELAAATELMAAANASTQQMC